MRALTGSQSSGSTLAADPDQAGYSLNRRSVAVEELSAVFAGDRQRLPAVSPPWPS
jgi:hypothetical protein